MPKNSERIIFESQELLASREKALVALRKILVTLSDTEHAEPRFADTSAPLPPSPAAEKQGWELVRAFYSISAPQDRQAVLHLAKTLARISRVN